MRGEQSPFSLEYPIKSWIARTQWCGTWCTFSISHHFSPFAKSGLGWPGLTHNILLLDNISNWSAIYFDRINLQIFRLSNNFGHCPSRCWFPMHYNRLQYCRNTRFTWNASHAFYVCSSCCSLQLRQLANPKIILTGANAGSRAIDASPLPDLILMPGPPGKASHCRGNLGDWEASWSVPKPCLDDWSHHQPPPLPPPRIGWNYLR